MSDDKPDLLTAEGVEEIFATDDRATVDVYIPEWKKTVRLRQLTAAESVKMAEVPVNDGLLHIVSMSIVDASGNRLFKDHDRLRGRSAAALSRIQDEALKLNGLTGKVATAVKNG